VALEGLFALPAVMSCTGSKLVTILMVIPSIFCGVQVTQLTGFSDPVYAEAYVHVNQYDIVLDVLVVNQTNDTLQNLTVELATLGWSSVSAS